MLPELLKLATPKKSLFMVLQTNVLKILKHLNQSYFHNYGGFTR